MHYQILSNLIPLARTPLDKQSSQWVQNYTKQVSQLLDELTPWERGAKSRKLSQLRKNVNSGTIVVIPDAAENVSSNPLYAGATIKKR